jgi:hypothetical protein
LGKLKDIYELNQNDLLQEHQRQFCLDTLNDLMASKGFYVPWAQGVYLKSLPLKRLQALLDFQENLMAMCRIGFGLPELCIGLLIENVYKGWTAGSRMNQLVPPPLYR